MDSRKYKPFQATDYPERKWPGRMISRAPIWCAVDLRDGNQSIERPMSVDAKLKFFKHLCDIGFKEIEIGFPSASGTEYAFTRRLIEEGLIPEDVTIQVLTQSREDLIRKTFESIEGARRAVVHLYNSVSPLQRELVFRMTKDEVKALATSGAALFKELAQSHTAGELIFEYSPENFSETEPEYALEVVNAVLDIWRPTPDNRVIINLPATVEASTPNIFADQVERFIGSLSRRDSVIISIHAHNDRGCAVAATELALLAGADRVEGTLFGNGERTGNADILTLALNLYTQGIDPGLDLSQIDDIVEMYEQSTCMRVHPRHPYAGRLVYTSFSGSHQNAIERGMDHAQKNPGIWQVPYLPIDPRDVGRSYAEIVRFNSQSGKNGAAYILRRYFNIFVPRGMRHEVGSAAKALADSCGRDLSPEELFEMFKESFVNIASPLELLWYDESANGVTEVSARMMENGVERRIAGTGVGPIDAFVGALSAYLSINFEVADYSSNALTAGTKAKAVTCVHMRQGGGTESFGAGVSSNTTKSALRAIISAVNRALNS